MLNKYSSIWPSKLPWSINVPNTSVAKNLYNSSKRYPEKIAIVFFENEIPYSKVLLDAELVATYLQKNCNIKKGDRVLLDLQNSPQFVIAFYGILIAGAIVVPVNPMSVTGELKHYCEDSGCRVAITSSNVISEFEPLLGNELQHLLITKYEDYLSANSIRHLPQSLINKKIHSLEKDFFEWKNLYNIASKPQTITINSKKDAAAILYTSGTTGKPKGCTHTHFTMMHSLVGASLWESLNHDSVSLATAPMFHVTGMQHSLNTTIYTGSKMVILPRWDPDLAGSLIEKYSCTHWANVPTMVVDLLAKTSTASKNLSSLKVIFGGGAPMPESVAQELYDRCRVRYMEGYGMTETISQTHMNPPAELRKQCLGIPYFDTESIIVDPDTLKTLKKNERGEILVRGPQTMNRYWNNADATSKVFVTVKSKTYLRTGDLGFEDSDGFFYISDRLKRMINASGFKVWPAEVESIMYKNPKIKEVAIISSPHERRGETVKAVVSLKEGFAGTTEEEIIAWAKKNMSAYKVPKIISFIENLPKSGTGKIQWRQLQEQEWRKS